MGKCRWTVRLEDGEHTVELEHGYWSGKRQITVDGALNHSGGGFFLKVWAVGSRDVITLCGHTCEAVVRPNFRTNNYDYSLIVEASSSLRALTAQPIRKSLSGGTEDNRHSRRS